MKKTLSLILSLVMIISTFAVFTVSSTAAGVEGEWTVWGRNEWYDEDADPEDKKPLPGYEYNDDGFHTISPDYTNYTPWFTVQTKEKQDLSNGYYLEVRVDEFAYSNAGEGKDPADAWISFSIWSQERTSQGVAETRHGFGYTNLMRGGGSYGGSVDSVSTCQAFTCGNAEKAEFSHKGNDGFEMIEKDGAKYVTLEIDANFNLKICGKEMSSTNAAVSKYLNEVFPNKEAYISITFHTGVANKPVSCTITKAGPNGGTKPTGTDKADPEANTKVVAPIAPSDTIPAGQPAILFDGTLTGANKAIPTCGNATATANEDGSLHILTSDGVGYVTLTVRNEMSFEAKDFPYVGILTKNFCVCEDPSECDAWDEQMSLRFYAGENMTADDTHMIQNFNEFTIIKGSDGTEYKYGVIDLSDLGEGMFEGRINGLRYDFQGILQDAGRNSFDICYVGCFRSEEEAKAYAEKYTGSTIEEQPTDPEETDAPPTEAPTDEAPTEAATKAPATTEKPKDNDDKKGCKSVAGVGAVAVVVAALGAGVVSFKRKRK